MKWNYYVWVNDIIIIKSTDDVKLDIMELYRARGWNWECFITLVNSNVVFPWQDSVPPSIFLLSVVKYLKEVSLNQHSSQHASQYTFSVFSDPPKERGGACDKEMNLFVFISIQRMCLSRVAPSPVAAFFVYPSDWSRVFFLVSIIEVICDYFLFDCTLNWIWY